MNAEDLAQRLDAVRAQLPEQEATALVPREDATMQVKGTSQPSRLLVLPDYKDQVADRSIIARQDDQEDDPKPVVPTPRGGLGNQYGQFDEESHAIDHKQHHQVSRKRSVPVSSPEQSAAAAAAYDDDDLHHETQHLHHHHHDEGRTTSEAQTARSWPATTIQVPIADAVAVRDEESIYRVFRNHRCSRRTVWALVSAVFLLAIGVVVVGFCASGACGRSSSDATQDDTLNLAPATNSPTPDPFREASTNLSTMVRTPSPTLSSTDSPATNSTQDPSTSPTAFAPTLSPTSAPPRGTVIATYINNITLSGEIIEYPTPFNFTPEEQALQWLIEDDPLQLSSESASGQFRLQQRYALAALWFQSTQTWDNSMNWLEEDECSWYGITCEQDVVEGSQQGVVSKIELGSNSLGGNIPADLGLLPRLKEFSVSENALSGTLPESLGLWTRLELFNVDSNEFMGRIPESVGNWSRLSIFSSCCNILTGPLPESIGRWKRLTYFSVFGNALTGSLPSSIGQWSRISGFDAFDNDFTGSLPESIGPNWTQMSDFSADGNAFTGTLPDFGQWTDLSGFWIYNNNFGGGLPTNLNLLTNLKIFDVQINSLTGQIPESVVQWNSIEEAYFQDNGFSGTMPFCDADIDLITLVADCDAVDCSCCTEC